MRLGWHLADCCRDRNQVVVARRYVEISPSTARDRYIRLRVMGTTISSRCLPARWPLLRYPQRGDWRISVRELAAEAVPEEKTPAGALLQHMQEEEIEYATPTNAPRHVGGDEFFRHRK